MEASAQLSPYREVRVGGVLYRVAVDKEARVSYVETFDRAFRTPEGLAVGSTLEDVLATGAEPPWGEPGWAYHTKLPSGWSAAFVAGRERTDGPLEPASRVVWFFRRG